MRRTFFHYIPHPWDYVAFGVILLLALLKLTKNERGKYVFVDALKLIVGLCLLLVIFYFVIWMMSGFA